MGKVIEAAKVVSVARYGVFVKIKDGIEGHISQGDIVLPEGKETLEIGDVVKAEIANIDTQDRKLSLSMRIGEGERPAAGAKASGEKRASIAPKKGADDKGGGTIGELIKQKLGAKLSGEEKKDDDASEDDA